MNLLKFRVILTVLCCGSALDVSSPVEEKYNYPSHSIVLLPEYSFNCMHNTKSDAVIITIAILHVL